MIEGDARDEGTLICSLVVKGAERPSLMHDPEAVAPMHRVSFSRDKNRLIAERFKPFKPQEEERFLI